MTISFMFDVFFFFFFLVFFVFFFQAEDGIRDLVRSLGLGDVYKRQVHGNEAAVANVFLQIVDEIFIGIDRDQCRVTRHALKHRTAKGADSGAIFDEQLRICLLYTSDAADERSSVDLGGRRILTKKQNRKRIMKTQQLKEKRK